MVKDMDIGAFIVPTGVGASIGGYAGDASFWAREFSKVSKLIVNPNVVNAGGFSGINDNMFYVEGFSLDEFFKGNLRLLESNQNRIGVILDKSIPEGIKNVHINTINAVKTIYGCDIIGYDITDNPVGVEFSVDESGVSSGSVKDIETVVNSGKRLLERGAEVLAIVCRFEEDDFSDYSNGIGVDPVGGVEAIISHYVSRVLKVPCAHSPAFDDITISQDVVDSRCSSEYITPTYLPCILLGLSQAPLLSFKGKGIGIESLKYLIMPANSLGSVPVFECLKRGIPVYAIGENKTVLDITKDKIDNRIVFVESYQELFDFLRNKY